MLLSSLAHTQHVPDTGVWGSAVGQQDESWVLGVEAQDGEKCGAGAAPGFSGLGTFPRKVEEVTRLAEVMAVLVGRGASCRLWQGMILCTPDCSEGGPGELGQWAGEITCTDRDHLMRSRVSRMPHPLLGRGMGDLENAGGHCIAVRAMVPSSSKPPATHHAQLHLWESVGGLLWVNITWAADAAD